MQKDGLQFITESPRIKDDAPPHKGMYFTRQWNIFQGNDSLFSSVYRAIITGEAALGGVEMET